ncbi:hypothetical protein RNJ44_01635 [Nakaseomyces bracarensis]|uniref:Uncharacterized protein n=1 Tax=Nakaseomyces bracarensis TaxID=273131 RepID=A0ABR4NNB6_9SACH
MKFYNYLQFVQLLLPMVLAHEPQFITVTETVKEDSRTVMVPIVPNTVTVTSCAPVTVAVPIVPPTTTVTVTPTKATPFKRPSLVSRMAGEINFIFGIIGAMKTCLPDNGVPVPPGWARIQCSFYVFNMFLSLIINIIGAKDHHEFWKKRQQQWREWEKQYGNAIGDDDYDTDCEEDYNDDDESYKMQNNGDVTFKATRIIMNVLGIQVVPFKNETTLQECAHYEFTKEGYKHIMGPELIKGTVCLTQKGIRTFERLREDGTPYDSPYDKLMKKLKQPVYLKRFEKYMGDFQNKKTLTTWQMINFREYARDIMEQMTYLSDELASGKPHDQIHIVINNKDRVNPEPLLTMNIL